MAPAWFPAPNQAVSSDGTLLCMNLCFLYKKFRSDLSDTKSNSSTFSFFLHCKMWISEYILKLDTVAAGCMWTSYPLHQFLHSLNLKGKNVLEFGSGGSTVFFLQRKANLVTFEHSEVWIEKLNQSYKHTITGKLISFIMFGVKLLQAPMLNTFMV
jgi:hypothetical protein